jgi:hypothetical protein
MDLNYLLGRHQQSLHRAGSAASAEARFAHRGMAAAYADRIRAFQRDIGAFAVLAQPA